MCLLPVFYQRDYHELMRISQQPPQVGFALNLIWDILFNFMKNARFLEGLDQPCPYGCLLFVTRVNIQKKRCPLPAAHPRSPGAAKGPRSSLEGGARWKQGRRRGRGLGACSTGPRSQESRPALQPQEGFPETHPGKIPTAVDRRPWKSTTVGDASSVSGRNVRCPQRPQSMKGRGCPSPHASVFIWSMITRENILQAHRRAVS